MFDAAIIETCADSSLTPALVRPFIEKIGAKDPFEFAVGEGNKAFALKRPKSLEDAKQQIQIFLGRANIRFGPTAYPVGIGAKTPSDVDFGFLEPCQNIRMGTALFAEVVRKVQFSLKTRTSEEAFEPALKAYISGFFNDAYVFSKEDFPSDGFKKTEQRLASIKINPLPEKVSQEIDTNIQEIDPRMADISIDLSALKTKKRG